ncbi:thioesterase II family protein [Lentzea sp. NEAU-D7]|uniref:thioesterase II family protein n=1 Tax=Lentzea sp. NEAU-D7 TaxID=2994667 RepID=UPI00224B0238|nr:alpha/beta fold hydrolase [Lentzea sp. NEAU-D7]MCX2953673.1 alpha/beta fold hydrolase [Lentzea sp. NEAU-D7]
MTTASITRSWLPYGSTGTGTRLFCFPHAGASAAVYAGWRTAGNGDPAICPVQLPGRAARGRETPHHDPEALADDVISGLGAELTGDYALFGHSVGALVAYLVARRIVERGGQPPRHLFVSGRPAPQLPNTRRELRALPTDDLVGELRALGGLPDVLLKERSLLELFLPLLRADMSVNETYRHVPGPPLPIPLTVFGGTDDPRAEHAELAAWQELSADSALVTYPGGHFYLEDRVPEMLEVVRGRMAG